MTRLPTFDEAVLIRFFANAVDTRRELIRVTPDDELLTKEDRKDKEPIHNLIREGWLDEVGPDSLRVSKQTWDNIQTIRDLVDRSAA